MSCLAIPTGSEPKGSAKNPFQMFQGLDFSIISKTVEDDGSEEGRPVDHSLFDGRSQMRRGTDIQNPLILEFTVTQHPDFNWKSFVKATAAQTQNIPPDLYFFDVKYTSTVDSSTLSGGSGFIVVQACATKPL